jgi:hypothetical protein
LFFLASYSFGLGGFWAVCWYWYLVSPCSFQPSRNIWIRRVRSMPRFIVSMARLKHAQALEKIVDTFVNIYETYTKRLWHVAFVVNCIWALCELYVTSMWHVFETATYMRRLWDAIEMHVDIHKKYTYRGVGLHFQIRWKLHVCCKT